MTWQTYVSRVTRAGDGARSEGFALDARKSAQFCVLMEPHRFAGHAKSSVARDRPDSVARSAVAAAGAAAAHVGLARGCALDPAPHRKYEVANMQPYDAQPDDVQPYRSRTDTSTESCLGGGRELTKRQPSPRPSEVSPRGRAHSTTEWLPPLTERPSRATAPGSVIRDVNHNVIYMAPPYSRGVLEMDCTGLVWRPLRLAPGRRPKREN